MGFMWRKVKDENGKLSDKEQEVEEKLGDPLWQKLVGAVVIAKAAQEGEKRGWFGGTRQGIDGDCGGSLNWE